MISIIVSSYRSEYFDLFSKNVESTIGVDYEIIRIHNPGTMGLCEAYNKGVRESKYPYICFSHEDILFKTQDWGKILICIFNTNQKIGVIGVAGSTYKPWIPSGWSFPHDGDDVKMNLTQAIKGETKVYYNNSNNEKLAEVVSLDGCWFASTKEVALENPFDDTTFKGYHCYDIDYSLSVGRTKKNMVTFEISMEHFSEGNFDHRWIDETLKLHRKWKDLPCMVGEINKDTKYRLELGSLLHLYSKRKIYKISISRLLKLAFSYRLFSLLGSKAFRFQIAFIKKALLLKK